MAAASVELLGRVALFAALEDHALDRVAHASRVFAEPAGATLFREGEAASSFFVIQHGTVKLTQLTPEGHQVVLRLISAGDAFGGAAAFGGGSYPVTADAVTDVVVYEWPGPVILELMERYPKLAISAARFVAARLHELQIQYRQLATERVERRIARALMRLAHQAGKPVDTGVLIDLPLSRDDVAQMTGTTLYTVSRIVSRWEAEGLVAAGRQRIVIKKPQLLLSIADDLT